MPREQTLAEWAECQQHVFSVGSIREAAALFSSSFLDPLGTLSSSAARGFCIH